MEVTIDESFTRTSPISSAEKQMLIGLITQEPILKNRKTDGKLLEQKRRAWARITQHFNAHNMGPKRTEGQLRKIWEKIRVKANQEDARQKREIFRTSGGTPPKVLTPETEQVLSILGTDIQDIGNPYDHDAMSSQATSHRHGRLIRFTKSLFVRENSYSTALYEVVHLKEPAAPPLPTPAEEPTLEERNSVAEPEVSSCPSSSGKRRQRSARRALQDHELYGTPGGESASNKKEEMQRRFLEKRDALMDLQMQQMQVRLEEAKQRREEAKESWEEAKERREEAKERREEARLYKEIAWQKLLELRNKQ
ncbi:myb/SANT-like DNA-binding domain-containing protein 3 [Eriocheir sinensis]|uniref:myb/SANT-like DNA-binding domain-containing protein 3 n=1 Tax=Eriocheir sinensis TaxID=95602 RepID=UPI0021C92BEE|nr:myb/SANT-like DNA-binding domain-containing protein 3 [Eriocheir sinensis]